MDMNHEFLSAGLDSSSPSEKLSQSKVMEIAKLLESGVALARTVMKASQDLMKSNPDKHLRKFDFNVGDKVYLDTHHWKKERLSPKLDNPFAGPFKIIENVGESFRVEPIYTLFSPLLL
ncbi:hypothetical protein BJ878DRAFT_304097 [Calycina marina]|uniref:Uncharacterized protein n=1 Tax=Calycina marina TaxID=1763456 RepID=A0A9P7YUL9_9HELO|nr:hypothetical protein BJ878DRAFT_304097 [Calycina marina]